MTWLLHSAAPSLRVCWEAVSSLRRGLLPEGRNDKRGAQNSIAEFYCTFGIISASQKGLSGICRDRPAYLVFGVRRIANPPHIWRYTTPIPNEPQKERGQNE